jgi:hypothetical protein
MRHLAADKWLETPLRAIVHNPLLELFVKQVFR